ncbi:UPF0256 protein [Tersicoccus solisilvae]|uniref:UPF0256 protein n=1 Tax=Tersicoccus solisilvae TaxID=1882339 RepID=A0ABQ1P167_9MICC|nr:UPF0256 protein [Tersicoccus solisilvae]
MVTYAGRVTDSDEYQIRRFRAGLQDGTVSPETEAWLQAVNRGFHEQAFTPKTLRREAEFIRADDRLMTGVYVDATPVHSVGAEVPVATFTTYTSTLSTGETLLPAHLISDVTVRPTHRRRGLLRRMMTESLTAARDAGLPIAALTASEATIYGRFGFGVATQTSTIELDTTSRFALPSLDRGAVGTVELARREAIAEVAGDIFARFHAATRGSVGRQASYPARIDGTINGHADEPDLTVRAALHYDADGTPDGCVTYQHVESRDAVSEVKVIDLVATGPDSYLGLWNFVGNLDLIQRVRYDAARIDDPLPWAMADTRGYRVTGRDDRLWLRILDPLTCLQSRRWSGDGELSLAVEDPLGLAAGTFDLGVSGGVPSVQQTAAAPRPDADVTVDVASLGSAFLGGATIGALADAGRIRGGGTAVAQLSRMFAVDRAPYCITHF